MADESPRSGGPFGAVGSDDGLTPVDLLLGEGTPAERDALRRRIAEDPLEALRMADATSFVEGFRQLRVEPSALFSCKLADVIRRAERRTAEGTPLSIVGPVVWTVVAAAATLALLYGVDPLGRRSPCPALPLGEMRLAAGGAGAVDARAATKDPVLPVQRVQWESAVEKMRQRLGMESSSRLSEALESGLRGVVDPLECWLDPRNALALLRVEHERRTCDDTRTAAVQRQGGMVAADARAQVLADVVARDLREQLARTDHGPDPREVALAVRALIAAGALSPLRAAALAAGSEWLAAQVQACSGADLVVVLAPLVEVAAVTGQQVDLVRVHGQRLVDDVLRADDDTWGRRRPELLMDHVPAATMADAGRVLGLLPAFGVASERCRLVRELVLGQLRERRDRGESRGPEVLAAMLFGGAELLTAVERDEIEQQLRRWHVARLAPDFVTVQQVAWSFAPGRLGFTRLQRELRSLAVLEQPADLGGRSAFCLCLATNSAAWRGGTQPDHSLGD